MSVVETVNSLAPEQIENIEKLTVRWIFQAVMDFGMEAYEIFLQSPDDVKDVAEDITREVLDRLAGYNVPQRIFGTVDYKKARYIILPEQMVRQALFVDSKAEKSSRNATVQMSQTSMLVRQTRGGKVVEEAGLLPTVSVYGGHEYLTTTAFVHFSYKDDDEGRHRLKEATVFCIPNGFLQERYNPSAIDDFWQAGRNAPSRGEDFRVRVGFSKLKQKASWRVQRILYDECHNQCVGEWSE